MNASITQQCTQHVAPGVARRIARLVTAQWVGGVAALLLLGGLAAPAAAETIKVADVAGLQAALDAAAPGDTVLMAAGEWLLEAGLVIPAGKNGLVLRGQGRVLLDGGKLPSGPLLSVASDGVTIAQLTLRHASTLLAFASDTPLEGGRVEKVSFFASTGAALTAECNGLVVTACSVRAAGSDALLLEGDDIVVETTSFTLVDGSAVELVGERAVVRGNRLRDMHGLALLVAGAEALVEGNRVEATQGILLLGNGHIVRGNDIQRNYSSDAAIQLEGDDGLVEQNTIERTLGNGIEVSGNAHTVRGNRVEHCGDGSLQRFGVHVVGDINTIDGNTIASSHRTNLGIDGDDNVVTGNRLQDASDNGVLIALGSEGTALSGNRIQSNRGEGLENRGTGTTLTDNTLLKNRRDVTNDVEAGATITLDASNTFATGGAEEQPEV